jgi:hypothetical protein
MLKLTKRSLQVLAIPAILGLPLAAQAQSSVNPYLPSTTKPPGPQNPAPMTPGDPVPQRNASGVIAPPQTDPRMPIIHPQMPSRMPVIPPAGTPGGNPAVVPK